LEYLPYGDLKNLIQKSGYLSEGAIKRIFRTVVLALKTLKDESQIAHLDMKSENLMFDD
jgi:serine/threonine protein kinase